MYEHKPKDYFSQIRSDLWDLIPPENRGGALLEIGAGGGDTLIACKENGIATEVVGIELMKLPDSRQNDPRINNLHIGSVEVMLEKIPNGHFDAVLCGDVLEHLVDPWQVVAEMKKKLRPNGVVVASIPNVRHLRVLFYLIFAGDFRYTPDGILDRTHLRFFCKKNIADLFSGAGYKVLKTRASLAVKAKILDFLALGLARDFLATQYIVLAADRNSI